MIKKMVWQDKKDFEVPVNLQMVVYIVKVRYQISLIKIYLVRQTRCPKKSWYPLRFHDMMQPNLFCK